MKKLLLLIVAGVFVLGLSSCDDRNQKPERRYHKPARYDQKKSKSYKNDRNKPAPYAPKPYKKPYKQTPKKQKY